jgi:acyl-CoA dehydrogenase
MDIYANKSMLCQCAWLIDENRPAAKEVPIVKASAAEGGSVLDRCIQVLGAMGLTNELRVEIAYRYARAVRVPDGTSEIQQRTIASKLLDGARRFN